MTAAEGSGTGAGSPPRRDVLIIGLNYQPEPTGVGVYTTGLAVALTRRGHRVRVVTGYPHYPAWKVADGYTGIRRHESIDGVDVLRVRHPVPHGSTTGAARIGMEAVFAAHAGLVRGGPRPDVVIGMSPALLSVATALSWRRPGRTAVGVISQDLYCRALTETGAMGGRAGVLASRLESGLLGRADGVAVLHDVLRDTLVTQGVEPDRVSVIRNWTHTGTPTAGREETRRRMGWADGEVVALHAGNMGLKQGLENVVDAARTADVRGAPVRFVLLGHGARRAALEERGRDVRRLEFVDPLPDGEFENVLAAADVLVLNEKVGIAEMCVPGKLTTYFGAGRPVVAATAPHSGAGFEVGAAGAGVCVLPGEPVALLDAVLATAADRAAADEMGARGRRYAAEVLGEDTAIDAYEAWVHELARRAGVPASTSATTGGPR